MELYWEIGRSMYSLNIFKYVNKYFHVRRSHTLLSELLKYQWNSTSGGLAEILQGTNTSSPWLTAIISRALDLQTGLSAQINENNRYSRSRIMLSYILLPLVFCLKMIFPLSSELCNCSFLNHILRYSAAPDFDQTQGAPGKGLASLLNSGKWKVFVKRRHQKEWFIVPTSLIQIMFSVFGLLFTLHSR